MPRFMASPRAALIDANIVFEKEVSCALRWNVVRLGTATAIKMTTKASVTINSINVKPLARMHLFVITSTPWFWCPYKFLCLC